MPQKGVDWFTIAQMNADKRAQMQTIADFRLSETGPRTQTNAHEEKQTQTEATAEEIHSLLPTPFWRHPNFADDAAKNLVQEVMAPAWS